MAAGAGAGAAAAAALAAPDRAGADCVAALAAYVGRILKNKDRTRDIPGMKCLLLDRETRAVVTMVCTMSDIFKRDVFLVKALDDRHTGMGHLKAVCVLRPTNENLATLLKHMKEPSFSEYHIFFTNFVPGDFLRRLAEADTAAIIKQVQEFYLDYTAINPDLFSVSVPGAMSVCRAHERWGAHEDHVVKRTVQGLSAVLLSHKMRPYIRFQVDSPAASKVASELHGLISTEKDAFAFSRAGPGTLLLLVDRREDPVTPLLTQWTYQAMVHELMPRGIRNNVVDMRGFESKAGASAGAGAGAAAGGAKKEEADDIEVVLSAVDDKFYANHMYANFGDLAVAVSKLMNDYSAEHKVHEDIRSLEQMANFFDKYPQLRAQGRAVTKHATLLTEINHQISKRRLMELSEVEQNITASDDAAGHREQLMKVFAEGPVNEIDGLRLLMIYTLRYEKSKPALVAEVRRYIADKLRLSDRHLGYVDALLAFGGASVRMGDLFAPPASAATAGGGLLSAFTAVFKPTEVAGATNVYTQHQPQIVSTLQEVARQRLKPSLFPFTGPDPGAARYGTVIIFIMGGVTYEEAAKVADINAGRLQLIPGTAPGTPPPFRVLVGGTNVLNANDFLAELARMYGLIDAPAGGGGGSAGAGAGADHSAVAVASGAGTGLFGGGGYTGMR